MINILLFKFCWHYFQALSLHLLTKLLAFFSEFVPTPFTTDWYQHVQQWILWMESQQHHPNSNVTQASVRVHPNLINDPPFVLPSPPPLSCIESGDIPTCIFTVFVLVCRTICRIFICVLKFIVLSWILQFCSLQHRHMSFHWTFAQVKQLSLVNSIWIWSWLIRCQWR